jgi:hypothetical protein
MKNILPFALLCALSSCTTIHYRSNNTIPVSFEGNPKHKQEVSITGEKHFYFWGLDPEHHEVYVDEEVRKAGHDSISKLIIFEHKNPQDTLISFLTFGLYMPRGYTITGFTSGRVLREDIDDN